MKRVEGVEKMLLEGMTVRQIAAATGLSLGSIYERINASPAAKKELWSRKRPKSPIWKSGVPVGRLTGRDLARRDPAFLGWLIAEVPQGATLTDVLIAIAEDAYHEQQAEAVPAESTERG